jgi:hypothetical protein
MESPHGGASAQRMNPWLRENAGEDQEWLALVTED